MDHSTETTIPDIVPDKSDVNKYVAFLEEQLAGVEGIAEAGGIAFTEVYGKKNEKDKDGHVVGVHIIKINLTGRGVTASAALKNLLAGLATAASEFHMYPWIPGTNDAAAARREEAARANHAAATAEGAVAQGAPAPASTPAGPAKPAGATAAPRPAQGAAGSAPAHAPAPAGPAKTASAPAAAAGLEIIKVNTVTHVITPNGNHCLNVKGGRLNKHGVTAWPEILPAEVSNFEEWPVGTAYPIADYGWFGLWEAETDGKKVTRFIPKLA
jgi:hypothetical protein